MLQMELWNYQHFAPYTMLQLETGEAAAGVTENWTNTTAIGPDSAYRYGNTIRRSVAVGTPQTVTSTFTDDIFTDISNAAYIELVLRAFPAQAAAVKLDLANSYIDFTSDPAYAAGKTDSIRFNQSVNSLTAGGDLKFRIDRNLLVNSTLTNLTGVRFRLTAIGTGTMTFIASALRVIPQTGYTYEEVDVDTKRRVLAKSVPAAGGTEPVTTFGMIYFNQGQPIDTDYYARFYNGFNPVGNDNKLVLAFRYSDIDSDDWRVTLTSRSTQSRLSIDHWDGASLTNIYATSINTNILPENKPYFLRVQLQGDQIKASVYKAIGTVLGSLVYETPWTQLSEDVRVGYVGYSFEPYNYDFYLEYVGSSFEQYGFFESTVFESNSYVKAAKLYGFASKDIEVYTNDALTSVGDVVTSDFTTDERVITRSGNSWYGGMKTVYPMNISDANSAVITGEILAASAPRGDFRIVITDAYGQCVWRSVLNPLVRNQWREFKIHIGTNLMPDEYNLEVHQTGFYPDTIKIRNLNVTLDSVDWYASNDAGTNYYPFLNSIDYEFSALNFPNPGTQLQVKAMLKQSDG